MIIAQRGLGIDMAARITSARAATAEWLAERRSQSDASSADAPTGVVGWANANRTTVAIGVIAVLAGLYVWKRGV